MAPSRRYRRRPTQGVPGPQFQVPQRARTGPPPPPEILPHYWHPGRDGAQPPPEAFAKQLAEIAPDVQVCFSPVHERWLVWAKNPKIQHELCRGWQLLFLWEHPVTHAFLPLNELLFGNLVIIKVTSHPSAVAYYDKIVANAMAAQESQKRSYDNTRIAKQQAMLDGTNITTAGKGNKFALHHDNTTGLPSRGEAMWRKATEKLRMPSELVRQREDDKERAAYGS